MPAQRHSQTMSSSRISREESPSGLRPSSADFRRLLPNRCRLSPGNSRFVGLKSEYEVIVFDGRFSATEALSSGEQRFQWTASYSSFSAVNRSLSKPWRAHAISAPTMNDALPNVTTSASPAPSASSQDGANDEVGERTGTPPTQAHPAQRAPQRFCACATSQSPACARS
jgi:hypothetical protein